MCIKNKSRSSLCVLIALCICLALAGCNTQTPTEAPKTNAIVSTEVVHLGEGKTTFPFTVVAADGTQTHFNISTNKQTVGEALLELELISGEPSPYGLYVKTVNGATYEYDKGGKYWAFYVNDTYATTSVDITKIEDGNTYSFRVE